MSKLSPALKELINAPIARPGPTKAPTRIRNIYEKLGAEATERKLGNRPWITISTAATFTLNSPDSLHQLYLAATSPQQSSSYPPTSPVQSAELIREVGLKCISFNGIPRSINSLGAFRASLPADVQSQLETKSSRSITQSDLATRKKGGFGLWKSVYDPFETKLIDKLAESHPDLPVHILEGHYATLLSDPPESVARGQLAKAGRVLTSLVAIACLRAQTGVGPQVLSHVFGLRKAIEQGAHREAGEALPEEVKGWEWLATDEGSQWILNSVDTLTEAIGSNFAAKL